MNVFEKELKRIENFEMIINDVCLPEENCGSNFPRDEYYKRLLYNTVMDYIFSSEEITI